MLFVAAGVPACEPARSTRPILRCLLQALLVTSEVQATNRQLPGVTLTVESWWLRIMQRQYEPEARCFSDVEPRSVLGRCTVGDAI